LEAQLAFGQDGTHSDELLSIIIEQLAYKKNKF